MATNSGEIDTSSTTKVLCQAATNTVGDVLNQLSSSIDGLSSSEASRRLTTYGQNLPLQAKAKTPFRRLLANLANPLVILLSVLTIISAATGDLRAAAIMSVMIVLGVSIRYFQESRADKAAEELKAMVRITVTVTRDGVRKEIPLESVVPGDIVHLSAGDLVPADIRLISSKDLFINQSALTGESYPVEKHATSIDTKEPLSAQNLCFQGTAVEVGTATATVLFTGSNTCFGKVASSVASEREITSFEKGATQVTWLMIGIIAVMVPLVFLLNGLLKHTWLEAFMFALAVGVGLTPEMLPMIVAVNLSKGALIMARRKVIVKQLDSIQNLGAVDVLCSDKTGTLTEGRVVLVRHVDLSGAESEVVLSYGFLNSFYQTGMKNLTDVAILGHEDMQTGRAIEQQYRKIDEIPFDFERRRMSVIVQDSHQQHLLICKGAPEEVIDVCVKVESEGTVGPLDQSHKDASQKLVRDLNEDGFRVLALAIKQVTPFQSAYEPSDEAGLTLIGLLAFLDPPKETVAPALQALHDLQVRLVILTGDNETVTRKVCRQVNFPCDRVVLGQEIEVMSDDELAKIVQSTEVFAKLSPHHKQKLVGALKRNGHVVGFLGDGINDAPGLKSADVGISVDDAVDIAKESSDIILLEKSLLVVTDGIVEGRKVFANITKYIKMAASSNFGNMFSVLGASVFLPFLPMLPLQILTNNLLYDFSQTAIPTDNVDEEWLRKPRHWSISEIRTFILCIGPISSIFDYATFAMMLFMFNGWSNQELFHTGWFVESLLTQTLIIHVIRTNKVPFLQSRASVPLALTSLIIASIGIWLPLSPLAQTLGFVALPPLYWPLLALMLLAYVLLTQLLKNWLLRRATAFNAA